MRNNCCIVLQVTNNQKEIQEVRTKKTETQINKVEALTHANLCPQRKEIRKGKKKPYKTMSETLQ